MYGLWLFFKSALADYDSAFSYLWNPRFKFYFLRIVPTGSFVYLRIRLFSKKSQPKDPTNTMAYDTLPHNWSYQGDVMQKKLFIQVKIDRHDGEIPYEV